MVAYVKQLYSIDGPILGPFFSVFFDDCHTRAMLRPSHESRNDGWRSDAGGARCVAATAAAGLQCC